MIKYDVLVNTKKQCVFNKKIQNIFYRLTRKYLCFSFETINKIKGYSLLCSSQKIVKLLKSFLTLYMLKYAKPLSVNNIIIVENNKILAEYEYNHKNLFPLYGIINNSIDINSSDLFKNEAIVACLFENESKSLRTVINYYLIGKSKKFENDRFYYLFSSLNSLISYISKDKKGDKEKFNDFLKSFYNCKSNLINSKNSTKLLKALEKLFYSKPYLTFDKLLSTLDQLEKEYVNLASCKELEDTYREFFKYHFIYYLRCNIVHGEKSSVLFTLIKDGSFLLLKYANYVTTKLIECTLLSDHFKNTFIHKH